MADRKGLRGRARRKGKFASCPVNRTSNIED